MKKQLINSFTDKYSLNGLIESVKWSVVSADNQIKTSSTSDDKNILAFVTLKDAAKLSDVEFGVNDTAKLKKMLGVLGDEVEIVPNTTNDKITSITLTSEGTEVQYVTADLSVIPPVPTDFIPLPVPTRTPLLATPKSPMEPLPYIWIVPFPSLEIEAPASTMTPKLKPPGA